MRKLFYPLILALVTFSFAANVAPSTTQKNTPINVGKVIKLHTNTAASADTFVTTENQTYGPYEITSSSEGPMYSSMMISADAIAGTTPTMELYYQVTSGLTISDTTTSWTLVDTLTTSAKTLFVDLSSKVGRGIVFRVYNYDGTSCHINGKLEVMFKENYTFSKNK